MEGWNLRIKHGWRTLASAALLLLGTSSLHAELLCGRGSATLSESHQGASVAGYAPFGPKSKPPVETTGKEWETSLRQLQSDWEEVGEMLRRETLEVMMTMFFITWGTPPPPPPPKGNGGTPPPQTTGGAPPPPPPSGQGGGPPTDPTIPPPPPNSTPEPSSLVSALLGTGIASWIAWRKRRKLRRETASCG